MKSAINNQKYEFWKDHIQKWQESGLSQAEYCKVNGIKITTFRYYRNRTLDSDGISKSLNFIQVQPKPASSMPVGLQLLLPNGIRIGIPSDTSESLLKMVLNVAGQTPC